MLRRGKAVDTPGPVVAMVTMRGDQDKLLEAYRAYQDGVDARGGPPPGLLAHTCASTTDGLLLIDVWRSRGSLELWLSKSGYPVEPQIHTVQGFRSAGATVYSP